MSVHKPLGAWVIEHSDGHVQVLPWRDCHGSHPIARSAQVEIARRLGELDTDIASIIRESGGKR